MIRFENTSTPDYIKKAVKDMIKNNAESNGNISLEHIPYEEYECYDDSLSFINKNLDKDIYLVCQTVCGSWDQPITMVAIG